MQFKKTGLYVLAIVLLIPALFINLGLLTFIDDEGIRSLVALEMDLSGNLITPTLHGNYYYKKPPLFNWILLSFFRLFGTYNEMIARIPTVLALMAYGGTIFWYLRPKYGQRFAFLSAFMLITCGRILFWDAMLALIDITFSWVMFVLFISVYRFYQQQRYWPLFLVAYLLTTIGFLLKGLPAIVFVGVTLISYLMYKRDWKRLFSIQHIGSGLLCVALIGLYYAVYDRYNGLENVFQTLFTESTMRTAANFGIGETLLHLLSFPLEMGYHFLPWSIMLILFMRKDIRRLLAKDDFMAYCLLMFLANIAVYWTSPEVYPRYLLMHAPLIFIVYLYLFQVHKAEKTWQYQLINGLFTLLIIIIALGSFAPLFLKETANTPYLYAKVIGLGLAAISIAYFYIKDTPNRLVYFVLGLLVFRIGFNFYVLPDRNQNDFGDVIRQQSKRVGSTYSDQMLYVYKETEMEAAISFYMTKARGSIIPRVFDNFDPAGLYIIDTAEYPDLQYEQVDELPQRHRGRPVYVIGRLKRD